MSCIASQNSQDMTQSHTQILAVNGVDTFGKPIQDVAKMFVGDEGTSVDLRFHDALICVAVCCRVLQSVAAWCSVLQCVFV